jgi:hypothetical protein
MASAGLIHPQVDADLKAISKAIRDNQFQASQLDTSGEPLSNIYKISEVWGGLPPEGRLHVYFNVDTTSEHFILLFAPLPDIKRTLVPGPLSKRQRVDDGPQTSWLQDLYSKLWRRADLGQQIFRKVTVTENLYEEMERRLNAQHPDRHNREYDGGRNDVWSIKLDVLREAFPDNNVDQAHDGDDLNEDGSETDSLFPFTFSFLDLSTLGLNFIPEHIPSPLFIRREYDYISGLIGKRLPGNQGSVIVSGQPGTGEVLHLPP